MIIIDSFNETWDVFHRKNLVTTSCSIIKDSNYKADWNNSSHKGGYLRWKISKRLFPSLPTTFKTVAIAVSHFGQIVGKVSLKFLFLFLFSSSNFLCSNFVQPSEVWGIVPENFEFCKSKFVEKKITALKIFAGDAYPSRNTPKQSESRPRSVLGTLVREKFDFLLITFQIDAFS